MIKLGFKLLLCAVLWHAIEGHAAQWPAWQYFKKYYIKNGRVIDPSSKRNITTSEGQSYAMFLALCANDRAMFDNLLNWTTLNLSKNKLEKNIPSWLWGKKDDGAWGVLDENFASDSALWIAYDLLEAARLWHNSHYKKLADGLLNRLLAHAVDLPGLGLLILPGGYGFDFKDRWRLNPSYYPPQLMKRLEIHSPKWASISKTALKVIMQSSPYGMAPNWIIWQKSSRWLPDTSMPNIGSYDAIRVYLWVGMLADSALKTTLKNHFLPMVKWVQKWGFVPEKINVLTHKHQGHGPAGFEASLAPLMKTKDNYATPPLQKNAYYDAVLLLFSDGWLNARFRFDRAGKLILSSQGALHEKSH